MKTFSKYLLLCILGITGAILVKAQANITRVEYYIDTDPGYGKGKSVSITQGTNLVNQAVNLNPSSFTEGMHLFCIRARDAKGAWSLDNKWLFIKPSSESGNPNITRVEYFIDKDPGYGNGTAVSIRPGSNLANQTTNINPASLTEGIHLFCIRALDAKGAWSIVNKWLFIKPYAVSGSPAITRVEYFIDKDPGYGMGTAVSITSATNLTNLTANLNPASFTEGVHLFCIRAQDAKGAWSLVDKWLFIRPSPAATSPNITRVEYYIDKDPGYGKGNTISITQGTNLVNQAVNITPASLTEGVHLFCIRARDTKGAWSIDNKWLFIKPSAITGSPGLKQVEYYIDNDPGWGKGVPVAINSVTNLSNFSLPINIAGLSEGIHILFIRSKDAKGAWSLDNKFLFSVYSFIAPPSIVVNSVTDTTPCIPDTFRISYHASGTFNNGNVFKVELSDANGSFASRTLVGSYTGKDNSIITCTFPANLPQGTNYRLRVSSSNTAVTGITGSNSLSVSGKPAKPSSITGPTNVAPQQTGLVYSVNAVSGLIYNWSVPSDATINSGQGTASINVNWGTTSGEVTVEAKNECGNSPLQQLAVNVTSFALSANTKNNVDKNYRHVYLYPNPAKSTVIVEFTAKAKDEYFLEVKDITGRILLRKQGISLVGINKIGINVSEYAQGIYLVSLTVDKNKFSNLKLIKE